MPRKVKQSTEQYTNIYSVNGVYGYEREDKTAVYIRIRDDHGLAIYDQVHGLIYESNYQVFKRLYPALAPFFYRKVKWNR